MLIDGKFNLNLENLLRESVKIHGHLCPGAVFKV
jgi:formylmethanofuran dehydrogenase subunit E